MRESLHFSQIFGIESEMMVASAHRNPDKVREMVINAQPRGYGVIVAAAGMAAALPGPFIGLPVRVARHRPERQENCRTRSSVQTERIPDLIQSLIPNGRRKLPPFIPTHCSDSETMDKLKSNRT